MSYNLKEMEEVEKKKKKKKEHVDLLIEGEFFMTVNLCI